MLEVLFWPEEREREREREREKEKGKRQKKESKWDSSLRWSCRMAVFGLVVVVVGRVVVG